MSLANNDVFMMPLIRRC